MFGVNLEIVLGKRLVRRFLSRTVLGCQKARAGYDPKPTCKNTLHAAIPIKMIVSH